VTRSTSWAREISTTATSRHFNLVVTRDPAVPVAPITATVVVVSPAFCSTHGQVGHTPEKSVQTDSLRWAPIGAPRRRRRVIKRTLQSITQAESVGLCRGRLADRAVGSR
jgi:hypothetical protein